MDQLPQYLEQVAVTLRKVPQEPLQAIADALWDTYRRDGTILLCGNGGSASTASHFACDLTKWTARPGMPRIRSLAITDSIPLLTAWGNDQGYAEVFLEQLITHYRPGDLVFAISGSGNSPNILRAVAWANKMGAPTVGLCGFDGGQLAHLASHALHIANSSMPQVEDAHSTICHALAVGLGKRVDALWSAGTPEPATVEPPLLERSVGL